MKALRISFAVLCLSVFATFLSPSLVFSAADDGDLWTRTARALSVDIVEELPEDLKQGCNGSPLPFIYYFSTDKFREAHKSHKTQRSTLVGHLVSKAREGIPRARQQLHAFLLKKNQTRLAENLKELSTREKQIWAVGKKEVTSEFIRKALRQFQQYEVQGAGQIMDQAIAAGSSLVAYLKGNRETPNSLDHLIKALELDNYLWDSSAEEGLKARIFHDLGVHFSLEGRSEHAIECYYQGLQEAGGFTEPLTPAMRYYTYIMLAETDGNVEARRVLETKFGRSYADLSRHMLSQYRDIEAESELAKSNFPVACRARVAALQFVFPDREEASQEEAAQVYERIIAASRKISLLDSEDLGHLYSAMYHRGKQLENSSDPKELNKAVKLFEEAARLARLRGNAEDLKNALFSQVFVLHQGLGKTKAALAIYRDRAFLDSLRESGERARVLAILAQDIIMEDPEAARVYLEEAHILPCENELSLAINFDLGKLLMKSPDFQEDEGLQARARELFTTVVESDDCSATLRCSAKTELAGLLRKDDLPRAVELAVGAARETLTIQGDWESDGVIFYNAALLLDQSDKETTEYLRFYRMAAERGYVPAMRAYANHLLFINTPEDAEQRMEEAVLWLGNAADLGDELAARMLELLEGDALEVDASSEEGETERFLAEVVDSINDTDSPLMPSNSPEVGLPFAEKQREPEVLTRIPSGGGGPAGDPSAAAEECAREEDSDTSDGEEIHEYDPRPWEHYTKSNERINSQTLREQLRATAGYIKSTEADSEDVILALPSDLQDGARTLLARKHSAKKITGSFIKKFFDNPFFNGQVRVNDKVKKISVEYTPLAGDVVTTGTHRNHGNSYPGYDRNFLKDLREIFKRVLIERGISCENLKI